MWFHYPLVTFNPRVCLLSREKSLLLYQKLENVVQIQRHALRKYCFKHSYLRFQFNFIPIGKMLKNCTSYILINNIRNKKTTYLMSSDNESKLWQAILFVLNLSKTTKRFYCPHWQTIQATNAEYSNHKKEWNSVICSYIDGLREYNAYWNKVRQKD